LVKKEIAEKGTRLVMVFSPHSRETEEKVLRKNRFRAQKSNRRQEKNPKKDLGRQIRDHSETRSPRGHCEGDVWDIGERCERKHSRK